MTSQKLLRFFLSTTLLATIVAAQLPSQASCQMGIPGYLATPCSMACCKTVPMPKNCPHLKAQAPNDVMLSQDFPKLHLQVSSAAIDTAVPVRTGFWTSIIERLAEACEILAFGRPPATRGPPTDVHLFCA